MKFNLKTAALVGLAASALAASAASAAVVCNGEGECWHTQRTYAYKPEFGLVVHDDNWRWGDHDHYRWREHSGRGYWHGGAWVPF